MFGHVTEGNTGVDFQEKGNQIESQKMALRLFSTCNQGTSKHIRFYLVFASRKTVKKLFICKFVQSGFFV